MTDTDALVSELRDVFRVDQGETLHPRHPKYLGNFAADAIARLTRERDEILVVRSMEMDRRINAEAALSAARVEADNLNNLCTLARQNMEAAFKAADAARAELAECRGLLTGFVEIVEGDMGIDPLENSDNPMEGLLGKTKRHLKEAPHE